MVLALLHCTVPERVFDTDKHYSSTRSRAVENRVLLRPVASFMLESIREINAEAAATRRYLESMS